MSKAKKSTPSGIPHGLNLGQKCLYYARKHLVGVIGSAVAIILAIALIITLVLDNPFDGLSWQRAGLTLFFMAAIIGGIIWLKGKKWVLEYTRGHMKRVIVVLIIAPLALFRIIHYYGMAFTEKIESSPLYISCDKEMGDFEKVVPCNTENNGVRDKFLSAAQTAGAKVDAISTFDSKAQESGKSYTHVIFEKLQVKKTILVPAPPKKKVEEKGKKGKKKDEEEKVDPPTPKVVTTNLLRVIFITNVPKKDDAGEEDAGKPNEKKSWRVTVDKRNIATYLVSSPDQINFMFFTVGFYRSRGRTLSVEELKNIFGEQIPPSSSVSASASATAAPSASKGPAPKESD